MNGDSFGGIYLNSILKLTRKDGIEVEAKLKELDMSYLDKIMELQTRKPNRLKNYDYSQNGAYFITICVQDRKPILSQIIVGEGLAPPVLKLLPFGECIKEQINNLEIRCENVKIDNYVIMPNHIHILMRIENQTGGASPSPTVSDIICAFKSLSTLECKKLLPIDILFQRSYHDHIIRDNIDYQQIWQYIDENPTKWAEDKYNTNI